MRILFDFDPARCSACGACAVACMDQNDVDTAGGQQPYRRVWESERDGEIACLSAACLHCPDAPCVPACPAGCLYRDEDSGLIRCDSAACVGCRACAAACPYGAPTFRSTGAERPRVRMEKCHGCLERIEAGLQPACVRACPTGALSWRWAEDGAVSPLAELWKRWGPPPGGD